MRKRAYLLIVCAFMFVVAGFAPAFADEEGDLDSEVKSVTEEAGKPDAEGVVASRIQKQFGATPEQINTMRVKKLGYGEIVMVFSLAKGMPGGITDENISKIMAMRQGTPKVGWGRIAKDLGVKMGRAVSEMRMLRKLTREEMKEKRKEHMEKGRTERGGKGNKEMMQKNMDKPGKGGGK